MPSPDDREPIDSMDNESESQQFDAAKRIILCAITECLNSGIDAALVSAVLIGSGVSWYSRYHGETAILNVLTQTIADIQTGRHRVEHRVQ